MARPRKVTDERLLAAAGEVIGRVGPGFTLADVAAEVGVVTGTVAHRFGSKHELLAALSRAAIDALPATVRAATAGIDDPVAAIVAGLTATYGGLDDPRRAANNLAALAMDFADEQLRGLLAELYEVAELEIAALVDRADLPGAPPGRRAARILAALAEGSAIRWSLRPEGSLVERIAEDVQAVLRNWTGGTR